MKIICIGPAFPLRGGIANFNLALSSELLRSGHITEIISFSYQYPGFLFPGKTQFEEGPGPSGIQIIPMINSVNPFSWFQVAGYIRKTQPELVIIHYWMPFMSLSLGTISRLIKKDGKTKTIAITHNIVPHEKHFGWKSLTRFFVNSVDGFIAMSGSVIEDLKAFLPSAISDYIPHPVYDIFGDKVPRETALEQLGLPVNMKWILFFGVIRRYKGLELLLRAMPGIIRKNKDIRLIVAGEFYSEKEEYLALIEELQIRDQVVITDRFIPSEEVKYYFSAADLVVQPYISATQSGITQIAYHFEVPMVVTNVGGLAELVPDGRTGYVVPVDPDRITDAVTDYFDNNRFRQFHEALKTEKMKFTWAHMAEGILRLSGIISG